MSARADIPAPAGMLAELTHRCPLGCPYCSNPVALEKPASELDTAIWKRVFSEAAETGVLHVHLSGGEPCVRADIAELTAHCADVGLYTNLITSGVGLNRRLFDALVAARLDHLQLSIQDADAASAEVASLCERFLTNPVIEDSIVTLTPLENVEAA